MNLNELKENSENPRFIRDEKFKKLVQSIKDFPKMMELRPIIIDNNNVILGGNMRFKALKELKYKEVPDTWVKQADTLTEDEKKRFIITDNVGFGEWDFDMLANNWNEDELKEWGMDIPVFEELKDEYGEEFKLKDGDKEPFQQMTFTLADEQAERIKNAIADIKQTQEYKYCETFGNENSNGNALYLIVMQWAELKK